MGELIAFAFVALVLIFVSGALISENKGVLGSFCLISGLFFLFGFGKQVGEAARGNPLTKINGGAYKVVSVYDTGDRVSLWIEKLDDDKKKHLLFYQFSKGAFEGGARVPADAKLLVVTETCDFKRLQLISR